MRFIYAFLLAGCLLLTGCFTGSTLFFREPDNKNVPNLIPNPDFEASDLADSTFPARWHVISKDTVKSRFATLDKGVTLSGRHSLKIHRSGSNLYLLSEPFGINFTGGYFVKCSIRSAKPMQKAAKVHFWAYDAAGVKLNEFSTRIKAKQDWKQGTLSVGFLKNPVTFARLAILVPRDEDNTYWIDDTGCYLVHQFTRE